MGVTRPVIREEIDGWVGCKDSLCPGYVQKPTPVVRELIQLSYRELGGDMPGIERESVHVKQPDAECDICGGPVEFVDTPRPEYPQVSGQDDNALRNMNTQRQLHDVEIKRLEDRNEVSELKAALAQQQAQMAEMMAELQRRKGGRPPKVEDPGE